MSVKDPSWLADYLKSKEKVLILAGSLCEQIDFGEKNLLDYVAEIARGSGAAVAATGNTCIGLRKRGIDTKKSWAAALVNYTHYPWQDPIINGKPEVMVFVGYNQTAACHLASAVEDVDTVSLGNTYIEATTYSLPDASLNGLQQNLVELVKAL